VHCGKPLENDVATCPACGLETSRPLGARAGQESPETDPWRCWSDEERRTWLFGELRAALRVILGKALQGVLFAAAGGLIGYLVGDLRGLAIGAIVAFLLQFVLF
jgi:hypothetical protein